MIKNSEIMDMGNAAIKGFRFKAAGATFWGNLIILIAIFPFVFIFEEFKEPNVLSLENIFIDLVSNIVATIIAYTFGIGFLAYFYEIYKNRTSSFSKLFIGFRHFPRNAIVLFVGAFVIHAFTKLPIDLYHLFSAPASTEVWPIITLSIFVLALFFFTGYKLFPTWIALLIKLPMDSSTKLTELAKQTYRQVSVYNFNFFCLYLRFILWGIIGLFTLGIGFLWIIPFTVTSAIIFFDIIFNPLDYAAPKAPSAQQAT